MSNAEQRRLEEAETGIAWRRWGRLVGIFRRDSAGTGASHQTGWTGNVGVLPLLFRGSLLHEYGHEYAHEYEHERGQVPSPRAGDGTDAQAQREAVSR